MSNVPLHMAKTITNIKATDKPTQSFYELMEEGTENTGWQYVIFFSEKTCNNAPDNKNLQKSEGINVLLYSIKEHTHTHKKKNGNLIHNNTLTYERRQHQTNIWGETTFPYLTFDVHAPSAWHPFCTALNTARFTNKQKHLCHRLIMANIVIPPLSRLKNTFCVAAAIVSTEYEALIVGFENKKKKKTFNFVGQCLNKLFSNHLFFSPQGHLLLAVPEVCSNSRPFSFAQLAQNISTSLGTPPRITKAAKKL